MKYPNGSETVLSPGPWSQMVKVKGCVCLGGKARTARITGTPDTMWTVPASVKVKGRTVTGFVCFNDGLLDEKKKGAEFRANVFGKNYELLKGETK